MPHREAAWALLAERLDEAAWLCDELAGAAAAQRIAGQLAPVLAAMREIAQTLAAHLPAGQRAARQAAPAPPGSRRRAQRRCWPGRPSWPRRRRPARAGGDACRGRAGRACSTPAYSASTAAAAGQGCDAGQQALIVPRLVDSVLRPLADALAGRGRRARRAHRRRPGRASRARPGGDAGGHRRGAARAGERSGRRRRRRPGCGPAWQAGAGGRPELAEATAALQDLACRLAPLPEAAGAAGRALGAADRAARGDPGRPGTARTW